jgi:hypothetical protein
MAEQKLAELDATIARVQAMKRILALGLTCECLRLEDCVITNEEDCAQEDATVERPA